MATSQTATQTTSNTQSPSTSGGGIVGWRDANLSVGGLDLSGIGAHRSSASSTSGDITLGDRIIGGQKSSWSFGLVKIMTIFAGVVILLKVWKGKK